MIKTKPKLIGPKRHHFLPEFYLRGFTKQGMLAVYDRTIDLIRVQQPINTAVIGHFYTLKDSEGRKRFELESLLSEYEAKASKVISKLAAREEIDEEERSDLAIFIAFAAFRTPDMVDSLKALNSDLISRYAKQLFADVEKVKDRIRCKAGMPTSESDLEKEARELVSFAQSGHYTVRTDHQWAVRKTVEMALSVAPILAGRDWVVIHRGNEKKSFITTDAPVLLTAIASRENQFWGVSFGSGDGLVIFPLTESCVLLIFGGDGRFSHKVADTSEIRRINMNIAGHFQRFVIGRDEALVRSLVEHLDLGKKSWTPKMQAV